MAAARGAAKSADNRELFERMPVGRALWEMCLPCVLGQMVVLIYNVADTFFIGRTGNPYMVAATSLILPVFNLCGALSSFVSIGGSTLISRLLGVHEDEKARKVSSFTLTYGLVVGTAYALIVLLTANPLLRTLGASENTFTFARQYLLMVVVIGGVPTLLQLSLANLLRAVGCSRQAAGGVTLGGVLNMILDPLLMFVILPDGCEVIGAGLATMLSNLVSLCYFCGVILSLRGRTVLTLRPGGRLSGEHLRSAVLGGVPAGSSNLLFDFSQIMINRLMSGYGDIALAAIGIVLKAERIPLNAGVGICQGMMPIVAYNYAAGNFPRMKETMRKSRLAGLLIAGAAILFYETCAPLILHVFISNPQTEELGAAFLRARCLATPFMFMCFHMLYAFQGMGRAGEASAMAVIRQLILYVPLLLLMNRLFGMYGLVWTQLVSDIVMTGISFLFYLHLARGLKRGEGKRAEAAKVQERTNTKRRPRRGRRVS